MKATRSSEVSDAELASRIGVGAANLDLQLEPAQVVRLVSFLRLLERWNQTYNLTAVRDPASMVTQHVLDCLAAAAALRRRRRPADRRQLIDVGSGAGLPGFVIGVALPDTAVVCVDAVGKKAAFVTEAAAATGARNVTALHARAEQVSARFDIVASRAFASLRDFVATTRHLVADNGEWLAMKGKRPDPEIAALAEIDAEVEPMQVPGLFADRCLVWMQTRR